MKAQRQSGRCGRWLRCPAGRGRAGQAAAARYRMSDAAEGESDRFRKGVLVSAEELVSVIADPATIVLDVQLPDRDGAFPLRMIGIQNAIAVDLTHDLAVPGGGSAGNRPLPPIAALQHSVRTGSTGTDSALVYDDTGGLRAARAWWTLRWAGLANVRLLDGGLAAWRAGGHMAELGSRATYGSVTLTPGSSTLDAAAAAALPATGILIDARDRQAYLGGSGVGGHIPGALSAPARITLTPTALSCQPISSGDATVNSASMSVWMLGSIAVEACLRPMTFWHWRRLAFRPPFMWRPGRAGVPTPAIRR